MSTLERLAAGTGGWGTIGPLSAVAATEQTATHGDRSPQRPVTEVNGLRLAYRGLVTGLAAAYVWAALAMVLGWLLLADPLAPLRPVAALVEPLAAGSTELTFVIGLAGVQAAGGLFGMCFAYFFARYFTVRPTLAVAAPCVAILGWVLIAHGMTLGTGEPAVMLAADVSMLAATLGYGAMLGLGVPTRTEVLRAEAGERLPAAEFPTQRE
jgi:hypothetical protein